jgi:hypothetical protein
MPVFASAADLALGFALLSGWAALVVVNLMKGKWGLAVVAVLLGWLSLIGAFRLARPNSYWFRHYYDDEQRAEAVERFARWECKLCKQRFSVREDLQEHIATAHPAFNEKERSKAERNRGRGIL